MESKQIRDTNVNSETTENKTMYKITILMASSNYLLYMPTAADMAITKVCKITSIYQDNYSGPFRRHLAQAQTCTLMMRNLNLRT